MSDITHRDHIVRAYDQEMAHLRALIAQMGEIACGQTRRAVDAVLRRDDALAAQVLEREPALDALNMAADDEVFSVIARRQPTAADLRLVLAFAKVVAELERAGDKAVRVVRHVPRLSEADAPPLPADLAAGIEALAEIACSMLERSVAALTGADLKSAIAVFEDEARLRAAAGDLGRALVAPGSGVTGEPLAALMTAVHALERVGGHGGNVAEQLVYVITGEDARYRNRELLIDALRHRGA